MSNNENKLNMVSEIDEKINEVINDFNRKCDETNDEIIKFVKKQNTLFTIALIVATIILISFIFTSMSFIVTIIYICIYCAGYTIYRLILDKMGENTKNKINEIYES